MFTAPPTVAPPNCCPRAARAIGAVAGEVFMRIRNDGAPPGALVS